MREIVFFVEDYAHRAVLGALVGELLEEAGVRARSRFLNARGGHGTVARELKGFLKELGTDDTFRPDLVVVATDANCKGLRSRTKELREVTGETSVEVVLAVPDPHIERWLLVDGAAFKAALGKGCRAPDEKCERARYKKRLLEAVLGTGIEPVLGGIEFAEDIVSHMDLDRIRDSSLKEFIKSTRAVLKRWKR